MEKLILRSLLHSDEKYFLTIYPHLDEKIFEVGENRDIFKCIKSFYNEYGRNPNIKQFLIYFKNSCNLPQDLKDAIKIQLKEILKLEMDQNDEFFFNEAAKFIKKRKLTNSILEGADVITKGFEDRFGEILAKIENALSTSFDEDLGMLFDALEVRYEYYTKFERGLPTNFEFIDQALGGGFKKKTLNIVVAPSFGGKSLFMTNLSSNYLLDGRNIVYYTLEMTEAEIYKRIDSNLLGMTFKELKELTENEFKTRFNLLKNKFNLGKIIVKEYPAGSFDILKMKSHLQKLKGQMNFEPEIIFIDYLGLMTSSRISLSKAGMYGFYKAISEELHSIAKELDIVIITAAQMNRGAMNNLDAGMENVSDSLGIIQTADTVIALLSDNQLREQSTILAKFLKNRNTGILKNIILGVDDKMRIIEKEGSLSEEEKREIQKKIESAGVQKTANEKQEEKIKEQNAKIEKQKQEQDQEYGDPVQQTTRTFSGVSTAVNMGA